MSMWRAKQEETKSMWFRVPVSLKQEFERLRERAEAAGLDAAATFTSALARLARQLGEELAESEPERGARLMNGAANRANGAAGGGSLEGTR